MKALSLFTIVLVALAPLAAGAQDADWRMTFVAGPSWANDDSIDVIDESGTVTTVLVGTQYALTDSIWIGAALGGRSTSGDVFVDYDTSLGGFMLRGIVQYRLDIAPWLTTYAEAGADAWWATLEIDRFEFADDALVEADDFAPGLHTAIGVDAYLLPPSVFSGNAAGLRGGVTAMVTFDKGGALDFRDGGTELGTVDTSGLGFMVGLVGQF